MDRDETTESADEAFERLVVPELALLTRVAWSITRHRADAEDLVQDTLLRAYRGIERFDGRYPRAWLMTIMRNAQLNRIRGHCPPLVQDPAATSLFEDHALHDSAEAVVVDRVLDPDLEKAVARLPRRLRQTLELVALQGLSCREAACVLGVRAGTVMSRLHRARLKVRASVGLPGEQLRTQRK